MKLIRTIVVLLLAGLLIAATQFPSTRVRDNVNIPDILGYKTLKCDLHIHTVFSDGSVWPSVRSEEAWREGLDAIAITDHIEVQPHKEDLPTNHNRSYEIAKPPGDELGVTVIRGSEITRKMPPGHLNAIFLESSLPLDTASWQDAVQAANDQGAFVFWNHPGWDGQQPDGIAKWYQEHEDLFSKGLLHGIEVVNYDSYYPEVHQWCLDKKITMISNSDIHAPINMDYNFGAGERRPMTLVFASENSTAAIKEALRDRRTAVLWNDLMIGEERFLKPIYDAAVEFINARLSFKGKQRQYLQIKNDSSVNFELKKQGDIADFILPDNLTLYAGKTVLFSVSTNDEMLSGNRGVKAAYEVTNLKVTPESGLLVNIEFEAALTPKE